MSVTDFEITQTNTPAEGAGAGGLPEPITKGMAVLIATIGGGRVGLVTASKGM